MIPKSLLLGFLAVQAPKMQSATGPADIAVYSDAPQATVYEVLPSHNTDVSRTGATPPRAYATWRNAEPGQWNESTVINEYMTSFATPDFSWVYSRDDSFPNLPEAPNKSDRLFGGYGSGNSATLRFSKARKNVRIRLLYTSGGHPQLALSTFTPLAGEKPQPVIAKTLKKEWNTVDIPNAVNQISISIANAQTGGNVLLASVSWDK